MMAIRLKVILQTEAAERDLACLAMVASTHGNEIGIRELRRGQSISLKGATLSQIMGHAMSRVHPSQPTDGVG